MLVDKGDGEEGAVISHESKVVFEYEWLGIGKVVYLSRLKSRLSRTFVKTR